MRFAKIALLVSTFFCVCKGSWSQSSQCSEASLIIEKIQEMHVSPPSTNTNDFKKIVLQNFIHQIDPQALYLSQTEVIKITSFPLQLEKQQLNVCRVVNEATVLIKNQLTEYKTFTTGFLSKPLNFSTKDFFQYEINPDNNTFESKTTLSSKWSRWLKFQVLLRIHHQISLHGDEDPLSFEKRAREKVLAQQTKLINVLLSPPMGIEQSSTIHFFKALATAFDPHTEFFSKAEMKDFQTSISSKTLSWGFDFAENKLGQAAINRIVPGGPAWNSNVVHQGDVVTELSFENGLVLDPLDYSSHELNHELKDPGKNKIKITLQRLGGKSETVQLEKSEIDSEENNVQSFVLKGEKKIGYIHLPAFYTDWSDPSSKGCANDVAKELVKLKKENIGGIILDLRFNGGGLVKEAVDLAGIFIDFGPLMIFKEKDQALVLKDINRGVAYDGPLLILINGLSASASEIVAATLQDHHRAIIAGAPSFGKSTGQAVFPVIIRKDTLGFVKVTQEKIYRVTGKSHQQIGVTPDIVMPDLIDLFGYSEKNYAAALPNDSIIKKVYYSPLPAIPLKELSTKSVNRIESSPLFQKIKADRNNFTLNIPLELNYFLAYLSRNKTGDEVMNRKSSKYFDVVITQFDNPMLQLDSYTKEISNHLQEEIAESPYVEESFKILLDYIQFKSKQK